MQTPQVQIKELSSSILLNEMQKLILELLLNGYTYKSISAHLRISLPSVRQNAHRLYKKLKVSNRTEAIIKYRLQGDNKSYPI
jgi:DNA-binding NarL/FixJ family response regulator